MDIHFFRVNTIGRLFLFLGLFSVTGFPVTFDIEQLQAPLHTQEHQVAPLDTESGQTAPLHTEKHQVAPLEIESGRSAPLHTKKHQVAPLEIDSDQSAQSDYASGMAQSDQFIRGFNSMDDVDYYNFPDNRETSKDEKDLLNRMTGDDVDALSDVLLGEINSRPKVDDGKLKSSSLPDYLNRMAGDDHIPPSIQQDKAESVGLLGSITGESVSKEFASYIPSSDTRSDRELGPDPGIKELSEGGEGIITDDGLKNTQHHKTRHHHNDKEGRTVKMVCEPTPVHKLRSIMGPSYNARYMSIEKPYEGPLADNQPGKHGLGSDSSLGDEGKPGIYDEEHGEFYVHKDFSRELPKDIYNSAYLTLSDLNGENILKIIRIASQNMTTLSRPTLSTNTEPKDSYVGYTDSERVSISKRLKRRTSKNSAKKLPWECPFKIEWQDLGDNFFPRFLRKVKCLQKMCFKGDAFKCGERAFTLNILKRQSDECKPVVRAILAPGQPQYEQEWIFVEKSVAFCCECQRND